MKTIAFSCGDINGIGPEIIIKTVNKLANYNKIILPVPEEILRQVFKSCNINSEYHIIKSPDDVRQGLNIIDHPFCEFNPGTPTASSGETAFKSIEIAHDFVQKGIAEFLVTAPISKKALGLAGINFPGHTEMFQQWNKTKYPLMTFLSDELKCALVTIHEPLHDVPKLITRDKLHYIFDAFYDSLRYDFGVQTPRIAVLGLNPHAGEEGRIGSEEIDVIIPVIQEYKEAGFSGPHVPDAFFGNKTFKKYDAYIAMYHDQGLIPFKLMNFNKGVNYTAGLPIIRTSPDHGTAYDIAYKGIADEASFHEAVKWGIKIHNTRARYGKNS
ncbi:MAG: 4-hydroxythreonine-4-phosphate dehydrogenase [Melioribacteraceae bacterium]|nr:MAG: 4-hydroxythreonine-4-phosphate dehydrogenase [Melioribacteraceae bacterium]